MLCQPANDNEDIDEVAWTLLQEARYECGACPHCGAADLFDTGEQRIYDSGAGSDGERVVHWSRGALTCVECGGETPFEDSD